MKVGEIIGSILELVLKIGVLIFLITLIYKYALVSYDYGYRVFTEAPVSVGEGRIISVEIKEDQSVMEIGEMLQQKGLIRDAKIFVLQERLSAHHGDEVPGIYDLSTAMTGEEMIAVICPAADMIEEPEEKAISDEPIIEAPEEEELEIIDEDESLNELNMIEGDGATEDGE